MVRVGGFAANTNQNWGLGRNQRLSNSPIADTSSVDRVRRGFYNASDTLGCHSFSTSGCITLPLSLNPPSRSSAPATSELSGEDRLLQRVAQLRQIVGWADQISEDLGPLPESAPTDRHTFADALALAQIILADRVVEV
ncbi:hypothetical protein [Candidatus Chloroploca sp. Khr17]|uniref:hypothetical protein n=1 Tax=Candidatus Chloroploca sp. Khr17 TaxID=2496869 RepID=UPI00101CC1EC|nr:hypothetical protein [Candidatus Chloroploca sp. Khr17]